MEHIGVGVDGSAMASTALQWAAYLGVKTGAEVLAINAFQNPYAEVSTETHDRLVNERRTALETEWLAPAIETGATVRSMVREGDVRNVLLPVAEAESVDVVVLGQTGAGGGPGFLHLGSVVEYAAHHSALPLAVIPAGWSGAIEKVVIGVDGSAESLAAVAWVADIAEALSASVVAVHVDEPRLELTPTTSAADRQHDLEQQIDEWTAPLTDAGVVVTKVAQRDLHPTDALLGVAAARHADLLVIGTRGVGGFAGLRAGGVAMKVLHRASLPLVLVPVK